MFRGNSRPGGCCCLRATASGNVARNEIEQNMEHTSGPRVPHLTDAQLFLIGKLAQFRQSGLGRRLRGLKIGRWVPFLVNKYYAELSFQRRWVKEFVREKDKVLEYWRRYRYFDEITAICQIDNGKKILDVGCGISGILNFIPGDRYGIDPLADEYRKLYEFPRGLTIKKGFGEKIPFGSDFFDVVFCSNALDHTTDPARAVEEILRVLRQRGYFVLIVELFDVKTERDLAHPHAITRADIGALLGDRFEVLFERRSPWMLVSSYVDGSGETDGEQLIMVMRKP